MGLFSRNKHNRTINDSIFGPLKQRSEDDTCFEGTGVFDTERGKNTTIPLVVYASQEGPTPAQRDFYLQLQSDFRERIASIIPLIEKELKLWGKDIIIKDFFREFTIATITISAADESPVSWEVILNTIHDTNHQIIVDFSGDEPVDMLIDV